LTNLIWKNYPHNLRLFWFCNIILSTASAWELY
jgi:hypothetical protein